MDLSVREVARLLDVSEKTVHRWLRDKAIPARRLHDQTRFNRVEIQEWAAAQGLRIAPPTPGSGGEHGGFSSLRDAVERGGVHFNVPGTTPEEALAAVTRLPGIPDGVNRSLLCELLAGREALMSTGIGGGIAIPHPRDPLVMRIQEPVALVSFLERPIDFRAIDGVPVRVLITLLSPTVRVHLELLSRLSFALHDQALLRQLRNPGAPKDLLDRLEEIEAPMRKVQP